MFWLRALLVALVGALVGSLATFILGGAVIRGAELNNYAALQTQQLVFFFVPVAGLASGFIGFFIALRCAGRAFGKTVVTASGIVVVAVTAASAAAYVAVDKPPKSGGQPIVLEFEVRLPASVVLPVPLNERTFYPSFFETRDAHWYAHFHFDKVVSHPTETIIPGYAQLRSSKSVNRSLLIAFGNDGQQWQRIYLPLRGHPKVQESWSDWISAKEDFHHAELANSERMSLRYRIQVGDRQRLAQDAF